MKPVPNKVKTSADFHHNGERTPMNCTTLKCTVIKL